MSLPNVSTLPKVTLGLPTWNRRDYLTAALGSALAQSYSNLEVVVSNNASTDSTASYLDALTDPRIVVLHQLENIGGIPNLNACLARATGELFLLLSDDDLLEPHAVEHLAQPFHQPMPHSQPAEVGLTWSNCRLIDAQGHSKWTTLAGPACESPLAMLTALFNGKRGPRLSSVMIRTEDARRAGGYNLDRYNAMCDTANWGAAALPYAAAVCVAGPLVRYRVHAASHTSASQVSDWQRWGAAMHEDLLSAAAESASATALHSFRRSRDHLLANLTVDVMMRNMGSPGWTARAIRELLRSRRYLLSPYTAKRLTLEGWKLLR